MKNLKYKAVDGRGLPVALPVPSTAVNGVPLALGNAGLYGIPITDRVTPELRAALRAPQGLRDGQATVLLPGIGMSVDLGVVPNGTALFSKLYLSAAGALTTTNTDLFVGWLLPGNYVGMRNN